MVEPSIMLFARTSEAGPNICARMPYFAGEYIAAPMPITPYAVSVLTPDAMASAPASLSRLAASITLPLANPSATCPTNGASRMKGTTKDSCISGMRLGRPCDLTMAMAAIRMALSASAEKNCATSTAIIPSDSSGISGDFLSLIAEAPRASSKSREVLPVHIGAMPGRLTLLSRLDQRPLNQQRMQPATIRAQYRELPFADLETLTTLGQLSGGFEHQAANSVIVFVAEFGAHRFVEVGNLGIGFDAPVRVVLTDDVVLGLIEIVFVGDVADDLFQHVFDGDHAADAAVLIHHQRDVVAVAAEIPQQDVEAFRFRYEYGRAQHVAHVELFARVIAQQVFRQQNADDVVLVAVSDGEARVRGVDDVGDELFRRVADVDDVHLRAGDHDLAHLALGDLHDALHHGEGIGIQQVALVSAVQQRDQLLAIFRLAQQQRREPFQKTGFVIVF